MANEHPLCFSSACGVQAVQGAQDVECVATELIGRIEQRHDRVPILRELRERTRSKRNSPTTSPATFGRSSKGKATFLFLRAMSAVDAPEMIKEVATEAILAARRMPATDILASL